MGQNIPVWSKAKSGPGCYTAGKRLVAEQIIKQLERELDLNRSREQGIRQLLEEARNEAIAINEKYIQYNILKRDVESIRGVYNALVKTIKEQSLTEQTQAVNVSVIREAFPPAKPSYPNTKKQSFSRPARGLDCGYCHGVFCRISGQYHQVRR